MDLSILEDIGLTKGEIKVYLALLKIGQSSTGNIEKQSGVSRSKIYAILDKLSKKGLVGHLKKGKVTYYKAMEAKRLIDFLDEKNKKLESQKKAIKHLLPKLSTQQKTSTEAILFEGPKAIKNFYRNILDDLNTGETYYVLGATYGISAPGIKPFFENYHRQRAKKKIKVKMLANNTSKSKLVKHTLTFSEVKYLPQYLVSNMNVTFYKNKSFIFFLTDEPVGFLLINKEVTKGFKAYFDTFWKLAKK